jgi:hypothetical protein
MVRGQEPAFSWCLRALVVEHIRESSLMASGWSPEPVLRVQVSALPLSETIRPDQEHVSKTCGGNHSVASSSLAVSAFRVRREASSAPHRLSMSR